MIIEALRNWRENDWTPVSGVRLAIVVAVALGLSVFYAKSVTDYLPIIDHVNLAFHEAGHLFYGIFGDTMGWLGGTLGQLTVPLIVLAVFWRQGDTASVALAGMWFFQNGLNIARYLGDARSQIIPLVGGGQHDWTHLLSQWGVLQSDTMIASYLGFLSWLGIWGMVAWFAWMYRMQED